MRFCCESCGLCWDLSDAKPPYVVRCPKCGRVMEPRGTA